VLLVGLALSHFPSPFRA